MIGKGFKYGLAAIIGGLLGFAIAKKIIYEIQKEEWHKEDEAAYLERIKEHYGETEPTHVGLDISVEKKEEPVGKKQKQGKKPSPSKVVDYTAYTKPSKKATPAEEVKDRLGEDEVVDDIRIITFEEYGLNEIRERRVLTYYQGDDTVVDENDHPIPSPENLIGDEALLKFGLGSGDPDVVYVRNDKVGTDYEVVRKNNNFIKEEPAKKPDVRRRSRRIDRIDLMRQEAENGDDD